VKAEILVKAGGNEWSKIASRLKTKKEIKELYLVDGEYSLVAKYEGEETSLRAIQDLLEKYGTKGEVVILHATMKKGRFRYFSSTHPNSIHTKK